MLNFNCSNFGVCGSKVTYSMWAKIQKAMVGNVACILKNTDGHQGMLFFFDQYFGFYFNIALNTTKRWYTSYFGGDVDRTKWNQFTFTVDDSVGVCAFVNGRKRLCRTTSQSTSLTANENVELKIGGAFYHDPPSSFFFDDFAVWQAVLTDDEVMAIYRQSK